MGSGTYRIFRSSKGHERERNNGSDAKMILRCLKPCPLVDFAQKVWWNVVGLIGTLNLSHAEVEGFVLVGGDSDVVAACKAFPSESKECVDDEDQQLDCEQSSNVIEKEPWQLAPPANKQPEAQNACPEIICGICE